MPMGKLRTKASHGGACGAGEVDHRHRRRVCADGPEALVAQREQAAETVDEVERQGERKPDRHHDQVVAPESHEAVEIHYAVPPEFYCCRVG